MLSCFRLNALYLIAWPCCSCVFRSGIAATKNSAAARTTRKQTTTTARRRKGRQFERDRPQNPATATTENKILQQPRVFYLIGSTNLCTLRGAHCLPCHWRCRFPVTVRSLGPVISRDFRRLIVFLHPLLSLFSGFTQALKPNMSSTASR